MDLIRVCVDFINGILWDYVLLVGLVGVGVFLSVKLKFPQVFRMFPALSQIIRDIKNKVKVPAGRMTPFQSLSTAIAAQVGTGNIVGVSTAIAAGGPWCCILDVAFGVFRNGNYFYGSCFGTDFSRN